MKDIAENKFKQLPVSMSIGIGFEKKKLFMTYTGIKINYLLPLIHHDTVHYNTTI